jgi:uncharacterized protein YggE
MTLKTLALAAAVLLTPVLALAPARAADLPSQPFIHVTGQSSTYIMPDVGELDFAVSASDPDPERARGIVDERTAAIDAMLTRYGVDRADVEVHDVQKTMRAAEPAAPGAAAQYQIKCNMRIKVRTIASWANIVDALLAMPNLDEFGATFDTTERNKVEADLLAEALRNARKRAEGIAAGVGRKLGAASGVTTGELRNVSRAMGMAAADIRPTPGVAVVSDAASLRSVAVIRLAQPVDVIYSLK